MTWTPKSTHATASGIAPRDFRYFEDLGERNDLDPQKYARYRERTFDRDASGFVQETKPVGGAPDQGYTQSQFDDLVQSYQNREHRLMGGQEWLKGLKLPPRPNL